MADFEREDVVERGQAIYDQRLRALVETPGNIGKEIVIDVDTGDYAIDADGHAASDRLIARHPHGRRYGHRIGYVAAYSMGGPVARDERPIVHDPTAPLPTGLLDRLLMLEEAAWRALSGPAGAAFYAEQLTDDAVMVFPFGVLDRAQALAAIAAAPPWTAHRITEPRLTRLREGVVALSYQVTAQRAGQEPYTARLTTIYLRQQQAWRPAFHQQSPIAA